MIQEWGEMMKGLKLFAQDWLHIVRHRQARVAVTVLLLIPLLYAGMFLLGYWDPYGRLDKLPVAVVNLDKGATTPDGKALHIGEDLIANLNKNKALDFHFVTSDDAENGLKSGQYDMLVSISADFSQKVTTLKNEHPEQAAFIYKTNPGNNFIAGQIGAAAIDKLKDEVGNEITKSYTETVFHSLKQLSDGLAQAGNGAFQLSDGTKKAQEGIHSVQEGINRLTDGAARLSAGVQPLSQGQAQLGQSMLRLKDGSVALNEGLNQLAVGHQKLEEGASNLVQGTNGLSTGVDAAEKDSAQLLNDAQKVTEKLQQYIKAHPELEKDTDMQTILQDEGKISQDAKAIHEVQVQEAQGVKTLQAGQSALAANMHLFNDKLSTAGKSSQQIAEGQSQVSDGMSKWGQGFQNLTAGIQSLTEGTLQLKTGTVPLADGMIQLVDGSGQLSQKLNDAAKETSGVNANDSMLSMFSRPVQVVENKLNAVPNYGTAMTPYFLTLGLFVGGLIASNIITFTRRPKQDVSGWAHFVNKICLFLSIALIQTFIVDAVMLYGFGIKVFSVPKFLLLSITASFTYASCIFMLVSLIGPLGRLAAIFLLVAQLASSGGTFPLQLAPAFIQYISKGLPMTYAVQAFRSVISTGDWSQYWHNTAALLWYMLVFLIVACSVILIGNEKHAALPLVGQSH
jgi:putative membrane protein